MVGLRRVVVIVYRHRNPTSSGGLNSFRNHLFLGVAGEGDGASHTSAQEQTLRIVLACGQAKYNAEFRCKSCKFQGASTAEPSN